MLIGLFFLLAFTAVWYLPILIKHTKTVHEPAKYYVCAFFAGFGATILTMILQIGFAFLLNYLNGLDALQTGPLKTVTGMLYVLVAIAAVEELTKFFLGRLIMKRIPGLSQAGCMLLMGMVGIGFGFVEEIGGSSILGGILNGMLALHLFFQLVMGIFMWRAWEAGKKQDHAGYRKNMALALLIPVTVHWIYDYFLLKGEALADTNFDTAFLFIVIALLISIAYSVVSVVTAWKTVNRERRLAGSVETEQAKILSAMKPC